jgi:hypothetical protein
MKKINCKLVVPDDFSTDKYSMADLNHIINTVTDNISIELPTSSNDLELDYVNNWLFDMDDESLKFEWCIDEDQKTSFHHNFSKTKLLEILRSLINTL